MNRTALIITCSANERMVSGRIAELLLSHEISLMPKDSIGFNALHHACIHNHVAIIDLLIRSHMDLTTKTTDHDGQTPLHLGAERGLNFNHPDHPK